MDVTCERCGTEYEFDETLVSDRGTTVKCTHCGHMFKVHPPAATSDDAGWTLHRPDGQLERLGSLRELQRRITTGELSPDDRLSRSDQAGKRLGDIAELQTFFGAARASGSSPPRRRDPTLEGPLAAATRRDSGRPRPPTDDAETKVGPPPSKRTLYGLGGRPGEPSPAPAPQPPPSAAASTERSPKEYEAPTVPNPAMRAPTLLGAAGRAADASPPTRGPTSEARGAPSSSSQPSEPPPASTAASSREDPFARTLPDTRERPEPPADPNALGPHAAEANAAGSSAAPMPLAPSSSRVVGQPEAASADHAPGAAPSTPSADVVRPSAPTVEGTPLGAGIGLGRSASSTTAPERPQARQRPSSAAAPPPPGPARPRRHGLYIDESDSPEGPKRRRKGRAGWIVAIALLAVAAAGVVVAWDRIAPRLGLSAGGATPQLLRQARERLREDHVTAYEEALELLAQASAHAEANAEVAEERARAHGLIAQAVDFEVKDLQARTGPEGVPTSLRTKRSRHVDKALERAKRAVDLAPESFKAHLALADALRLADRPDESERELEQAAALLNEADARRRAELSYVRGLSAMTRAGGDAAQAQTHAQAAVDEDPDLLRARLLLARAKLASGDVSQARAQLRAVLDREPAHPHAETLQDALDQGIAPAPAVLAVLDGGARDAGAIEAGTSEDRGTLARAASDGDRRQRDDPPQDETSDGVPAGRDADYYLRRGEELQTRGKLGQARAFCERALERSPGHPEALVCLGYVALDTGRLAEALSHFRAASTRDYAEAYIGLGTVYRRQGRPRKALDAYESYLSKFPAGQQRSIAERQASRLREQVDGPGPSEEPMPPEGQATPEEQAPAPREGAEPVAPQTDPLAIESDPETP